MYRSFCRYIISAIATCAILVSPGMAQSKKYPLMDISTYRSNLQKTKPTLSSARALAAPVQFPSKFNWRDSGVVTPAKDQGSCGSCWAFAVTGGLESKILMSKGPVYDLSELQQVLCNSDQWGCGGGWSNAYQYWETHGPMLESCTGYDYFSGTTTCATISHCSQLPYFTEGYYTADANDVASVKQSLMKDGPTWLSFIIYTDFYTYWDTYSPGAVYRSNATGTVAGAHAVLLIGWDDAKGAYLLKNSWGPSGGPNGDGTFWIAYEGHAQDMGFGFANCKVKQMMALKTEMKDVSAGSKSCSQPSVRITNLSTSQSLKGFTVRLWFSREEYTDRTVLVDTWYTSPSGITFKVSEDANNYDIMMLDIKYPSSYVLGPGQTTPYNDAMCQLHFSDWAQTWSQGNDWSWQGVTTAWKTTSNITVYDNNGLLICGNVPAITPKQRPTAHAIMHCDDASLWSLTGGTVQTDTSRKSEGTSSLRLTGGGYQVLTSRYIPTSQLSCEVSGVLSFDLANYDPAPNPSWIGDITVYASCPSANLNGAYLATISLNGMPTRIFQTKQLNVPSAVLSVMNGNYRDFAFTFTLNTNAGSGPYQLDRIRFSPSWESVGGPVSDSLAYSYPAVATYNTDIYIAYSKYAMDKGDMATVKKYQGNGWQTVGTANFVNTYIERHALAVVGGVPYLCFSDNKNGGRISVMKLSGTSWVYAGTAGFSTGSIASPCIAVDNGTVYVAYGDYGLGGKMCVKKLSGTSWVAVGTLGFAGAYFYYSDFAVKNGVPFVVFNDFDVDYTGKISVMKYNGSKWVYVGPRSFSNGYSANVNLGLDNNSVPFVAYAEYGMTSTMKVQKFDGTNWVMLPLAGDSLSYSPVFTVVSGVPYIVYSDGSQQSSLTVKKFTGTAWTSIGCPGITAPWVWSYALAVQNGSPIVAFSDPNSNYRIRLIQYK
jgi:hypothetical protein